MYLVLLKILKKTLPIRYKLLPNKLLILTIKETNLLKKKNNFKIKNSKNLLATF